MRLLINTLKRMFRAYTSKMVSLIIIMIIIIIIYYI